MNTTNQTSKDQIFERFKFQWNGRFRPIFVAFLEYINFNFINFHCAHNLIFNILARKKNDRRKKLHLSCISISKEVATSSLLESILDLISCCAFKLKFVCLFQWRVENVNRSCDIIFARIHSRFEFQVGQPGLVVAAVRVYTVLSLA